MNAPVVAAVGNEFLDYQYEVLGIQDYLASSDVTEICINKPGERTGVAAYALDPASAERLWTVSEATLR